MSSSEISYETKRIKDKYTKLYAKLLYPEVKQAMLDMHEHETIYGIQQQKLKQYLSQLDITKRNETPSTILVKIEKIEKLAKRQEASFMMQARKFRKKVTQRHQILRKLTVYSERLDKLSHKVLARNRLQLKISNNL